MSAPPFIVAVIATYRRPVELRRLLDSLALSTLPPAVIAIVDNAADPSLQAALRDCPTALWLPLADNAGCGAGLRHGAEWALRTHGEKLTHLLVLDDDVVVPAETLATLVAAMDEAGADLACPIAVDREGAIDFTPGLLEAAKHRAIRESRTPAEYRARAGDASVPLNWTTGTCLLVSRRALDTVGLHRADYWLRGEDLEYSLRVTARWRGIYVPRAEIAHLPPVAAPSADGRRAEFRRHCALVQNTTYSAAHLPHARTLWRSIPGTYRRFFAEWGWSPRILRAAAQLLWRGLVAGEPAGKHLPYMAPGQTNPNAAP